MTSEYIFPFIKAGDREAIEQWIKNNKGISVLRKQGCWLLVRHAGSGWRPGYLLEIKNNQVEFLFKLTFQHIFPYSLSQGSSPAYIL